MAWTDADSGVLFDNLQNIRKTLSQVTQYRWQDNQQLATDLLGARLRAKYHGGEYIILRPYIYNALRWQRDSGFAPQAPFKLADWMHQNAEKERDAKSKHSFEATSGPGGGFKDKLPDNEISLDAFQSNQQLANQFLWCCKRCIDAAMASTEVFDGVANPLKDQRLKVTNIHGTATA